MLTLSDCEVIVVYGNGTGAIVGSRTPIGVFGPWLSLKEAIVTQDTTLPADAHLSSLATLQGPYDLYLNMGTCPAAFQTGYLSFREVANAPLGGGALILSGFGNASGNVPPCAADLYLFGPHRYIRSSILEPYEPFAYNLPADTAPGLPSILNLSYSTYAMVDDAGGSGAALSVPSLLLDVMVVLPMGMSWGRFQYVLEFNPAFNPRNDILPRTWQTWNTLDPDALWRVPDSGPGSDAGTIQRWGARNVQERSATNERLMGVTLYYRGAGVTGASAAVDAVTLSYKVAFCPDDMPQGCIYPAIDTTAGVTWDFEPTEVTAAPRTITAAAAPAAASTVLASPPPIATAAATADGADAGSSILPARSRTHPHSPQPSAAAFGTASYGVPSGGLNAAGASSTATPFPVNDRLVSASGAGGGAAIASPACVAAAVITQLFSLLLSVLL